MKFDIIVGNPPYNDNNKGGAKRWVLWAEFVKKANELSDVVAMVVPQSITSPGQFKLIRDNAVLIDIGIDEYFDVGSTFCYFITDKNKKDSTVKIITKDNEFDLNTNDIDFIPYTVTQETIDQIDWLNNRAKRTWKRGELHTSNKELFEDDGKYDVFHTNAQTLKTDTIHENLDKIRVAVTLSGYPTFTVLHKQYCSQATFWTEFDTIADATVFAEECNNEPVQTIMKDFKWSGWNSKEIIQML